MAHEAVEHASRFFVSADVWLSCSTTGSIYDFSQLGEEEDGPLRIDALDNTHERRSFIVLSFSSFCTVEENEVARAWFPCYLEAAFEAHMVKQRARIALTTFGLYDDVADSCDMLNEGVLVFHPQSE